MRLEERGVGECVEAPRQARGAFGDRVEYGRREEHRIATRDFETVREIGVHLVEFERRERDLQLDAAGQTRIARDRGDEIGRADQQQRQQALLFVLEVEQHAQLSHGLGAERVRFVDADHHAAPARA